MNQTLRQRLTLAYWVAHRAVRDTAGRALDAALTVATVAFMLAGVIIGAFDPTEY